MKQLLILSFIATLAVANTACINGDAKTTLKTTKTTLKKENITFYSVPLVCNAYTDIGCGSRAKPVLVEMEKNPSTKEAWLNREGTVIGVVWQNEEQTNVVKPLFEKYEIDFTELKSKETAKNEKTFRKANLWYKAVDVDKLSIEEAAHIAETYVNYCLDKKMLLQGEADKIKPEIENYFKAELVKTRTPEQLFEDSENKFRSDVINIFISHIGQERTDKLIAMYQEYQNEQFKTDKPVCTKDRNDKCCKKKKHDD